MHDHLHRLYRTKLTLLAVILTVMGIGLLVAAQALGTTEGSWLRALPLTDLGSALFTTGLIVVAFECIGGRDNEERTRQQLRQVLQAEAPAIRDAVIRGFAFDAEDLARVAAPETLDKIIRNSLSLRLGDDVLAGELYEDLRDQAIRARERWLDVKVSARLSMPTGSHVADATSFVATIRWDYTVVPVHQSRRFVVVSDREEYRELTQDPAATSAWFKSPQGPAAGRAGIPRADGGLLR